MPIYRRTTPTATEQEIEEAKTLGWNVKNAFGYVLYAPNQEFAGFIDYAKEPVNAPLRWLTIEEAWLRLPDNFRNVGKDE